MPKAVLHELAASGGAGYLRPLVAAHPRVVARVELEPPLALEGAEAALPGGAARPEALAALLRRRGVEVESGETRRVAHRELRRFSYERGRSSVELLRVRPDLIGELEIGSWFNAGWRGRLARRALVRVPWLTVPPFAVPRRLAADVCFWAGVRSRATGREWRRLTKSSYVALCYHQISRLPIAGDEGLTVAPGRFRLQLALLRLLGYRPLTVEELIAFHTDPAVVLGRRRYLLTADDGYLDAVDALAAACTARPLVFLVSAFAAGREVREAVALAGFGRLERASGDGLQLGAHTRSHPSLVACADHELVTELDAGPLVEGGLSVAPVLAYPYGHHDLRVRRAAIASGFALAYTTRPGRNGAGTDRWCLRRISVQGYDGAFAFLWKVLTGESLPVLLDRLRPGRRRRRTVPA